MFDNIDKYLMGFIAGLNAISDTGKVISLSCLKMENNEDISISARECLLANMWSESELPSLQPISHVDMKHNLHLIFESIFSGRNTRKLSNVFSQAIDDEYGSYELYGEFIKDDDGDIFVFIINSVSERKLIIISFSDIEY